MKKIKEKDIQGLEVFCIITAAAIAVMSILFLFDFWQNYWFLNFILGLGVLLHLAMVLLGLLQHKHLLTALSLIWMLVYGGSLVYFNFF